MKLRILKIWFLLLIAVVLHSCGSDDDICISGEATPRLKIKFKALSTGKLKTIDTLFVSADYGTGMKTVIPGMLKADSALVPLRVDDQPYTDIFVATSAKGPQSKIRINYSSVSNYVSPACGIKKTYQNVNAELLQPLPVQKTETNETEIANENKTAVFLLF